MNDINLHTADIALNFTFEELRKLNTPLSISLHDALKERVNQRRTIACDDIRINQF